MPAWVYGIDSSYDELTLDEARTLKVAGVQVFAQCLWTGIEAPGARLRSLMHAQDAGLATIGYISVSNNGRAGVWHVDSARMGIPDVVWNRLVKVPVDVELTHLSFDTHVKSALDRVAALGKPCDVYTSYHAWVDLLGNPPRPMGVGLWNAIWDLHPDFDFPTLRYGGWQDNEVWGEQWSGGTQVHGQFADRNQFRADAVGIVTAPSTPVPTPPPTPPVPTDDQWLRAADIAATLTRSFARRAPPSNTLKQQVRFLVS